MDLRSIPYPVVAPVSRPKSLLVGCVAYEKTFHTEETSCRRCRGRRGGCQQALYGLHGRLNTFIGMSSGSSYFCETEARGVIVFEAVDAVLSGDELACAVCADVRILDGEVGFILPVVNDCGAD